jgi:hypothetical protein
MSSSSGWDYCGSNGQGGVVKGSGWLFRVNPSNKDMTDVYHHKSGNGNCYYRQSSYIMTWGGGHDLSCQSNFGYCYNNPNSYTNPNGFKNTDLAGKPNWKPSEMSDYEVYLVN